MAFIKYKKQKTFYFLKCPEKIQTVRGSSIVEMSYIMPLILLLFMLIIFTVFYYHDKIILNSAAAETAILGSQTARRREAEHYSLERFFQERINNKVICMPQPVCSIEQTDHQITVEAFAQKGRMKLHVTQKSLIVKPEEYIRWTK